MASISILDEGYHRRNIARVLLHTFGGSTVSRAKCQITVKGYGRRSQLWELIEVENLPNFELLELSKLLGATQEQAAEPFVDS